MVYQAINNVAARGGCIFGRQGSSQPIVERREWSAKKAPTSWVARFRTHGAENNPAVIYLGLDVT